jgi:hypothetical protein
MILYAVTHVMEEDLDFVQYLLIRILVHPKKKRKKKTFLRSTPVSWKLRTCSELRGYKLPLLSTVAFYLVLNEQLVRKQVGKRKKCINWSDYTPIHQ